MNHLVRGVCVCLVVWCAEQADASPLVFLESDLAGGSFNTQPATYLQDVESASAFGFIGPDHISTEVFSLETGSFHSVTVYLNAKVTPATGNVMLHVEWDWTITDGYDDQTYLKIFDVEGSTFTPLVFSDTTEPSYDPTGDVYVELIYGREYEIRLWNSSDNPGVDTSTQITILPEPASAALFALGGVVLCRRL